MVFPFLPFMSAFRNAKHHNTSQQQLPFLMKTPLLDEDEDRKKLFNLSMRYHEKWDKILAKTIEFYIPGVPRNNVFIEMQDDYAEMGMYEMLLAKKVLHLEKESVYNSEAKRAQDQLREEVAMKYSKYKPDDVLLPFQKAELRWQEKCKRRELKSEGLIGLLALTPAQKLARKKRILAKYGKKPTKKANKVKGSTNIVFKLVVVEPIPDNQRPILPEPVLPIPGIDKDVKKYFSK